MTVAEDRDAALNRLARAVARRGFAIAHDLLGDGGEAEDAVQESLARAVVGYDKLRDPAALEGWFYRVLTNFCMRTLRRRRLGKAVRRLWAGDSIVRGDASMMQDGESVPEYDLVDGRTPIDQRLLRVRDVARALQAIEDLPAGQRTALVLRYGHDMSVEQVATTMGIGAGTVKTHLVRGLRRLRGLVKE